MHRSRWYRGAIRASFAMVLFAACGPDGDSIAKRMCREAELLEATNPRESLALRRRIWETLPTTGTPAAVRCGRDVAARMGRVRALVATDERGGLAVVDGCEWAADALEVFEGSTKLPFNERWARRLMRRCIDIVGRAWTREPDSERLRELNDRLRRLSRTTAKASKKGATR